MKKLNHVAGLALAALLSSVPGATHAEININSEATGSLDTVVDIAELETDANIGANVSTDVEATTTEATNDEESGVSLRLNAEGRALTEAAHVNTTSDLEIFAYNVAAEDDMVEEVKVGTTTGGQSRVEVKYKHYGELFGLMPIVINSTTVATTGDGQIEVESDLPWWSIITTKKNHAAGEIESRIKDNPTIMMSAEMEVDARTQAEIAEAVIAELSAHSYVHAAINN
jgi:hypothetical protein